jgi:hypothetical protein
MLEVFTNYYYSGFRTGGERNQVWSRRSRTGKTGAYKKRSLAFKVVLWRLSSFKTQTHVQELDASPTN